MQLGRYFNTPDQQLRSRQISAISMLTHCRILRPIYEDKRVVHRRGNGDHYYSQIIMPKLYMYVNICHM